MGAEVSRNQSSKISNRLFELRCKTDQCTLKALTRDIYVEAFEVKGSGNPVRQGKGKETDPTVKEIEDLCRKIKQGETQTQNCDHMHLNLINEEEDIIYHVKGYPAVDEAGDDITLEASKQLYLPEIHTLKDEGGSTFGVRWAHCRVTQHFSLPYWKGTPAASPRTGGQQDVAGAGVDMYPAAPHLGRALILCVKDSRGGATAELMNAHLALKALGMRHDKEDSTCAAPDRPKGDIITVVDPSPDKVIDEVKAFRDLEWGSHACCVVCVMAHGKVDKVKFVNEKGEGKKQHWFALSDLFSMFKYIEAPKLRGKPKIFLIQSCRVPDSGNTDDDGVGSADVSAFTKDQDFLWAYATMPGDPAERGVMFKCFWNVVKEHAHRDWRSILDLTNAQLVRHEDDHGDRCTMEKRDTLCGLLRSPKALVDEKA